MDNSTSLKQLIQQLMPKQPGIILGRVTKENPLTIQAENDEKLILSKSNTIISRRFLENPLNMGERVYILSFNIGKKYYILDRV